MERRAQLTFGVPCLPTGTHITAADLTNQSINTSEPKMPLTEVQQRRIEYEENNAPAAMHIGFTYYNQDQVPSVASAGGCDNIGTIEMPMNVRTFAKVTALTALGDSMCMHVTGCSARLYSPVPSILVVAETHYSQCAAVLWQKG